MMTAGLAALFVRERSAFARVYPHVAGASLVLTTARHPAGGRGAYRDLACADPSTGEVTVAQRVLDLPRANLVALVRHELAHLARPDLGEVGADRLAAAVRGAPIRYDAHEIQTVGRGTSRPRHLHQ
jgi:hypothetical protein